MNRSMQVLSDTSANDVVCCYVSIDKQLDADSKDGEQKNKNILYC